MGDFTNSIEKLNNSNYGSWSTRIKFYLLGQDLWDVVNGSDTTPPREARSIDTSSDGPTSTPARPDATPQRLAVDPDILKKWKTNPCLVNQPSVKRRLFSPTRETAEDTVVVVVEDEDVVSGDSIVKKEMFEEINIEVSNQGELEELKIIRVVRTGGNKRIIKVRNVLIVARRDITQEIAGRRKLKEMSQHLLRMNTLEKKIGTSTLPSLWKKKTLLMHEGKAQ
ncbi:hypothetical protein POM88_048930 [Heracleum sosnowskyi]|uniref:DUF4219 domain-containing protein n=1 Tax=Heracleum sosnowskyi TaxID=360622 RepID=A0AAD8GW57_9APIA|nr:hypothetical protein POM88_048930 [Heracleum sosnowskyi]